MKIALVALPNMLKERERALLSVLSRLPYAAKAGCEAIFFPLDVLSDEAGNANYPLALLQARSKAYGVVIGLGYNKKGDRGYMVFDPAPKFISFAETPSFVENGKEWKILLSTKERSIGHYSLCFDSYVELESLSLNPYEKKDCFYFGNNGKDFIAGVFRNGSALCALPLSQEAMLIKDVDL